MTASKLWPLQVATVFLTCFYALSSVDTSVLRLTVYVATISVLVFLGTVKDFSLSLFLLLYPILLFEWTTGSSLVILNSLALAYISTQFTNKQNFSGKIISFSKFLFLPAIMTAILFIPRLISDTSMKLATLLNGYDNVSHSAVLKAIVQCKSYLSKCVNVNEPNLFLDEFRFTPQGWHAFFGAFLSSDDVTGSGLISTYILVCALSVFLAYTLLKKAYALVVLESSSTTTIQKYFRFGFTYLGVIPMMHFAGYPNYLLATICFVYGASLLKSNFFVGLGFLLISGAMYSIYFAPALVATIILSFRLKKVSYFFISQTMLGVPAISFVRNAFEGKQVSFLTIGNNQFIVVWITLALSLYLVIQRSYYKEYLELRISLYGFILIIIPLQILVISQGFLGGHYLLKLTLPALILSSIMFSESVFHKFLHKGEVSQSFSSFYARLTSPSLLLASFFIIWSTPLGIQMNLLSKFYVITHSSFLSSPLSNFAEEILLVKNTDSKNPLVSRSNYVLNELSDDPRFLGEDTYWYQSSQWILNLNSLWTSATQADLDNLYKKYGNSLPISVQSEKYKSGD